MMKDIEDRANALEVCQSCGGIGEIGGFDFGECAYRNELCPECNGSGFSTLSQAPQGRPSNHSTKSGEEI